MIRVVEFKQDFVNGKQVDMVLIAPSGEAHMKTQTWHRVSKLRPSGKVGDTQRNSDTFIAMEARWSVIEPAYQAWKSGSELPETGTPLAAWAGVTKEQADLLKSMAIRTVEDVCTMDENTFTKLPFPNGRKLPQLAKEFLEGADAAAKDKRIAEMEERMAAMTEMLEAQTKPAKKEKTAA